MMQDMARRLSSPIFVGRSRELQNAPLGGRCRCLGPPGARPRRRRGGRRQEPPGRGAAAGSRDRGWLVLEGGAVALGEDGAAVRPDRRGPPVARPPGRPRSGSPPPPDPSLPELARLVPELSGTVGDDGGRAAGQTEWLQTRIFEGAPAAARPARRDDPGPPRHRGPALGRSLDPRPARLPDAQRPRRAPAHGRDVPDR